MSSKRSPRARPDGGLVEHQDPGLCHQRHRERDLAVLAMGEVPHELVELVVDRNPAGGRPCPTAKLPVPLRKRDRTEVATTYPERREVDAVLDGEPEEHARLLVRARETELRALSRGHRRDVSTEQLDGSGRRMEVTRDDVEERGLPGPVRAENGMTRAVLDVEIDSGHGDETAEAPADSPQAESRRGTRSGRRSFAHSVT